MNSITITFTEEQLNIVFAMLTDGPFRTVAPIIQSIQIQAQQQREALQPTLDERMAKVTETFDAAVAEAQAEETTAKTKVKA